jgi:hypothetical protein
MQAVQEESEEAPALVWNVPAAQAVHDWLEVAPATDW